ncbi:hypothetical protein [Ornithinibacillus halotolerans]|uniref:YtkA-like domain-containing protein n=1 Tax=Ornithinibacillus halotolerans TaxID=1274357 RepID=A0A916RYI6_9BACI|nr:hypothetical protein [Ornithinibacillus halotolerans]GGA72476.1 hypothetical protein GCM10008025_15340 [Ornithinibacillus halotolerans]
MKKILISLVVVFLVMTGCSPDNFDFKVDNNPFYTEGKETEIVLSAHKDKELVKGLHIIGEMDPGSSEDAIELTFTDNEDGTYTGYVELPEAGDWVMLLKVINGEKESEYLLKLEVNEE